MNKIPPPHKSEKQFRRYEPHLVGFLSRWPAPYVCTTSPLSTATFCARLRDAISSVFEYGWTTNLDIAKLKSLRDQFEIVPDSQGRVIIGKVGSAKALAMAGKVTEALASNSFCGEVDNPEPVTIYAFAHLLSIKALTQPVKFTNLDTRNINEVCVKYDVGFAEQDGFHIMI